MLQGNRRKRRESHIEGDQVISSKELAQANLPRAVGTRGRRKKVRHKHRKYASYVLRLRVPAGGGNRFVVLSRSCSVSPVTKHFLRLQWQRHTPQLPAKCKWEKNKICIARIMFVLPIREWACADIRKVRSSVKPQLPPHALTTAGRENNTDEKDKKENRQKRDDSQSSKHSSSTAASCHALHSDVKKKKKTLKEEASITATASHPLPRMPSNEGLCVSRQYGLSSVTRMGVDVITVARDHAGRWRNGFMRCARRTVNGPHSL